MLRGASACRYGAGGAKKKDWTSVGRYKCIIRSKVAMIIDAKDLVIHKVNTIQSNRRDQTIFHVILCLSWNGIRDKCPDLVQSLVVWGYRMTRVPSTGLAISRSIILPGNGTLSILDGLLAVNSHYIISQLATY